MQLGFVSGIKEDSFRIANEIGFDGVEIAVGKWAGRDGEPTSENAQRTKELIGKYGLKALTVQWAEVHYELENSVDRLKQLVVFANGVETNMITTNLWVPPDMAISDRFNYFKKIWIELAKIAEDAGMKIAIENCPHGVKNLASCPATFRRMFELVSSNALGLQYDPSHFVFQFMDYLAPIREFGPRIYSFHAKDTQILYDRLNDVGVYGDQYGQDGWWRFRVPGYGDIDWRKIFIALSDIGYAGDVIIEHEDPVLCGEDGLRRGYRFLQDYIF